MNSGFNFISSALLSRVKLPLTVLGAVFLVMLTITVILVVNELKKQK